MKTNVLRVLTLCAAVAFVLSHIPGYAETTSSGGAASGSAGATVPSTAPFSPAQAGAAANQNRSTAPTAPATAGSAQQQLNQNSQNQAIVPTNSFQVATNIFAITNSFGTNQFGSGTNGFGSTNGFVFTNQFAISNFIAFTNLFFSTNAVSVSNRFGLGPADTAITELDRTVIITIRQRLFPLMQMAGGWAPISFFSDRGSVIVFGEVISIQERDQVLTTARATPGVVQIANGLFINAELVRTPATSPTGSISRFLQPASDPALGDYYLHSSTSNRLGQRTYNPPPRGTFVATNQNLPGVSNLAGATFTNLTPTGFTNALPIPLQELFTNTNAVTSPR